MWKRSSGRNFCSESAILRPRFNQRSNPSFSAMSQPSGQGELQWRLSSHPVTLLTFLSFRICEFWQAPAILEDLSNFD
jgi:hypothetical protein